jgi:hypothetical protein
LDLILVDDKYIQDFYNYVEKNDFQINSLKINAELNYLKIIDLFQFLILNKNFKKVDL